MKWYHRIFLTGALVLSGTMPCYAATQMDNPQYAMWAKFKPGTSITLKSESDIADTKSETEITTTLVDINPDKATLEIKMSVLVGGNKTDMPAQNRDVPAKMDKPADHPVNATNPRPGAKKPTDTIKQSTETIDVAGKPYKCNVIETKSSSSGTTTIIKVWTCAEIPGCVAKTETTMEGSTKGTTKMYVTAITIK